MKYNILFVLMFVCNVFGSTYYVDYSSGSDVSAGTTTGTAWKHMPGDSAATDVPAAATINGDTIYLKGGITYIPGNAAGVTISSARYNTTGGVTILSGDAIGWGTGRSVIDGGSVATHWFQVSGIANVTIRGLEMQNTVNDDGNGALFIYNSATNYIDSCLIHNTGTNVSTRVDGVELSGAAGYSTVTNCTIYNVTEKCIETGESLGNTIVNNFCHTATDHGICISSDLNIICGNVVSNIAMANVGLTSYTDPGYGIKLSSSNTKSSRSNLVYNNVVLNSRGGIAVDNVGNQEMIYNRIYNNTVIKCSLNNSSPAGVFRFLISSTGQHSYTDIQNNIFSTEAVSGTWEPVGIRVGTAIGNSNTISHNLWYDPNATIYPMINVGGTRQPTFVNFADGGSTSPDYRFCESGHGTANSFSDGQLYSDPLFLNYPGNLSLTLNSPCISGGSNLSAYFTTDILGNTRSRWSIGAYEYTTKLHRLLWRH